MSHHRANRQAPSCICVVTNTSTCIVHRTLQLQEAVFGKLLEREVAFYDRTGVGEIGSYLSQVNYLCGHV